MKDKDAIEESPDQGTTCILSFDRGGIFSLKAAVTIEYLTQFSSLRNMSNISRQILKKHDVAPKNASVRARVGLALEIEHEVIKTPAGRKEYVKLIKLSSDDNPYYSAFFPNKDNVDTIAYNIPTSLREEIKKIAKQIKKETKINITADVLSRFMYIMHIMREIDEIAEKFNEITQDFLQAVPKTKSLFNAIGIKE